MPELPEVEIAARQLRRWCRGQVVTQVAIDGPRVLQISPAAFTRALLGRRLEEVRRRGKWIVARLRTADDGSILWTLHLGMSGKLAWAVGSAAAARHRRVAIGWESGRLDFVDVRAFGRMNAGAPDVVEAALPILGPDALCDLRSAGDLARALGGSGAQVKAALMDQRRLAGLGNIQACEALFRAGIDPRRRTDALDAGRWERLFAGVRSSLRATLAATDAEEVRYLGDGGPNPFLVYRRAGEPCPRCAAPIERMRQGGRSTYWCPTCQDG